MMTWCNAKIKEQAQKKHTEITKIRKSSEASVSGRYNTPPLQEDLVPRSRMEPERNRRGREEVKLSCFFDQWVKPKNLERLKSWKKGHNRVEHNWEHCGRKIEIRNTMWTLEVAKLWMTSTMYKKELEPLWLKRDKQGTRKNKFIQHSGWKEMQHSIRWKELEEVTQHFG